MLRGSDIAQQLGAPESGTRELEKRGCLAKEAFKRMDGPRKVSGKGKMTAATWTEPS